MLMALMIRFTRLSITPMKSFTLWTVRNVLVLNTFRMGASSHASCLQYNPCNIKFYITDFNHT